MKTSFMFLLAAMIVAFFTAGFFPMLVIGVLGFGGNVAMGLHGHEVGSGGSYKSLH